MWCVRNDLCGLVCAWMTTGLLLFAVVVEVVFVIGPVFGASSFYSIANVFLTLLALVSHFRAQFTDPGAVPKNMKYPEDNLPLVTSSVQFDNDSMMPTDPARYRVNECRKCKGPKPLIAHHCSTCQRYRNRENIDDIDGRVNNCVAMFNQKYFLLFLFYTCLLCIFSFAMLMVRFVTCTQSISLASNACYITPAGLILSIFNFIEALIFGLFTGIMLCDQFGAIFDNTPYIDSLQGKKGTKRTKMESLVEVFGENFSYRWFLPLSPTAQMLAAFEEECKDFMKLIPEPIEMLPPAKLMEQ